MSWCLVSGTRHSDTEPDTRKIQALCQIIKDLFTLQAYGALQNDKWLVVVDGMEGKQYDVFLTRSQLVFDSPKLLHTLVRQDSEILRIGDSLQLIRVNRCFPLPQVHCGGSGKKE